MTFSLGLDTGGTYTDAVIFDDVAGKVIAKAKALTTRNNLAIGITGAAGSVIKQSGIDTNAISMVSISTTLATNALVEGQGSRAALIMIGFEQNDLDRAGLRDALGDDPVIFIKGGHDVHGKPKPLVLDSLENRLDELGPNIPAFAVAGMFAVRNPDHEIAVRDLIHTKTNSVVTCSHELSSKLDGPKRALTTLLNARLINMIARLVAATRQFLLEQKIQAPLMIVRGDGSLVSADFAERRPIETILSGPAASLVGAHYLTGCQEAIVSDIGGTTTDIAILQEGRPLIDESGAYVGGYRTMVDAVAMHTFGLGGDSEVVIDEGALAPQIHLGPRRLLPVSLLATVHPEIVKQTLSRQLKAYTPGRMDGRFAMLAIDGTNMTEGLRKSEKALLSRLTMQPKPFDEVLNGTAELATLNQLCARGLALISGLTPSDAQHVLGKFTHWNTQAAQQALRLFARRRNGTGKPFAVDEKSMAEKIVTRLTRLSAERVLETALSHDGLDGAALVNSPLIHRLLEKKEGVINLQLSLPHPLIALGAGAPAFYPEVANLIKAQSVIPDDADVANAIGAVVGKIRVSISAEILQNEQMLFEIMGTELEMIQKSFVNENEAIKAAETACDKAVRKKAKEAGAANINIEINKYVQASQHDGERKFVSATIVASAIARPALA